MVTKNKKYIIIIFTVIAFVAFLFSLLGTNKTACAASPVGAEDGIYSVPVDLSGLAMGANNFSQTATVEKNGSTYYFTFGHSSSISNLALNVGDKKVGSTVKSENGWIYYTYTLSEINVQSRLSFSAHINAMNSDVSFSVKLSLSSATRTGDYSYDGERPAEFIPVLTTSAGNEYEVAQGSVFAIPAATAVLGTEECTVTTSAYYLNNGEKQTIEIMDSRFAVENVGEYHLVYRASSPSYKTSLGNDTYTEYDVTIISSVGGSTLAKFTDSKGVLPEGTAIMASRIVEGSSVYAMAAEKMKTIADDFEVFGIGLVSDDGNSVNPSDNIALYLKADSTYDRTKVVVYHMDDNGNLTKLSVGNYGRYVKVDTDKTGTFIVCIPGVAFIMPMWGYAVICCVVGAIVIAAAITIPIVVVKRKKKKRLAMSDESKKGEKMSEIKETITKR